MKQPKYKGKELLPLSVIDAARDGDAQAVDSVLTKPAPATETAYLFPVFRFSGPQAAL